MADAWLGISGSDLLPGGAGTGWCGNTGEAATPVKALDGDGEWFHDVDEVHWFILDLGSAYTIKKVRGRSSSIGDPLDIDIFVSNSLEDWGTAVASEINTWQDRLDWDTDAVIDTVEKSGRYIKVVINDTEYAGRILLWKVQHNATWEKIFDAYGEEAGVSVEISVPCATVTSQAFSPTMRLDKAIDIPVATVASQAHAPTLVRDRIFDIPLATVASQAYAPSIIAGTGVIISVPVALVSSKAFAPSVGIAIFIAVPTALVTSQAFAPRVLPMRIQAPVRRLTPFRVLSSIREEEVE